MLAMCLSLRLGSRNLSMSLTVGLTFSGWIWKSMVGFVVFPRNKRYCSVRAGFVSSDSLHAKSRPTRLNACDVLQSGAGFERSGHEPSETTDF